MDPILDVVIGLVFMYLLLAIFASVLTEAMAKVFGLRAKNLAASLSLILKSDADGGKDGAANSLQTLFEQTGTMRLIRSLADENSGAFLWLERLFKGIGNSFAGKSRLANLEPESFANAVIEAAKATNTANNDAHALIDSLPNSSLKSSLQSELDGVASDVGVAKKKISDWFDTMMIGAADRYKRSIRLWTAFSALLIVFAFNADSLTVAETLWKDDALRTQVAENASDFVSKADSVDDLADLEAVQAELRPFPIGWDIKAPHHSADWYFSATGWAAKVLGLLISVLAVSLGAPFWFDLLKKLASVRSMRAKDSSKTDA